MKTLLVGLVLVSSSSFAHNSSNYSNSCQVEMNGGVNISQSAIEFVKQDKSLYKIVDNHVLVVNGKEVSLTDNQQEAVTKFSTDIRNFLPQVKELATDALDLASEGVSLVFNELLGDNNAVVEDLSHHFDEINQEIEQSFSFDQTIHLNENGVFNDNVFGSEFEERIETIVEQTMKNSIGSIMIAVGQELLFSGGNIEAFEARMENFGEQIEHEMEVRSQNIEKRADALCEALIKIDETENFMRHEISELSKFNVLTVSGATQNKA